jgi:hypothetical protein
VSGDSGGLTQDGQLLVVVKGFRQNSKGRSRFRIVGPERLEKGVGFVPYVFHESFVFRGILTRGLKLSPQSLDEDQTLASFVQGGLVSHGSTAVCAEVSAWESRALAYIRGSTFTS